MNEKRHIQIQEQILCSSRRVNMNQPLSTLSTLYTLPTHTAKPSIMSTSGPPADAKQARAAALQELETAQRKKRAIDTQLVCPHFMSFLNERRNGPNGPV